MNKDRVNGKVNEVAGRAKRQVGEWTGDTNTQVKGAGQEIKGRVQGVVGKVKDAVNDARNEARHEMNREEAKHPPQSQKFAAQEEEEKDLHYAGTDHRE
jgi:uncharacterized protein YjbJ (UPF0337 family)